MRVLTRKSLKKFWESEPRYLDAKGPLEAWLAEAEAATWKDPADIKDKYKHASILKGGRVVFNIKGNDYRLIVQINYEFGAIYVKWIGTHKDYDDIEDIQTIGAS
jgi:mRNA interferase HigB